MSTVKVINVVHPSSATNNIVLDSSGNASVGGTMAMGSSFMRNRIINGAMVVDQRNAGASVTPTAATTVYVLDRWNAYQAQSSKFSVQQNAGSVTPPSGFTNYLGVTSLSAYTVSSNDTFIITQAVEGYNVSDLNWGSANALPATLSFWVRSSITGTFGGSIATTKTATWVLPFSYTISSANTWTYVTVAIPAATSTGGTNNDNTAGLYVRFGLGSAGTFSGGTAGSWTNAGNYVQPSGTVSVVGTNAATWYITGVQLEVGSVATPFEREIYSQTLAKCQRYYYRITPVVSARICMSFNSTTTVAYGTIPFPIKMRATPTALEQSGTASDYGMVYLATSQTCSAVPAFLTATPDCGMVTFTVASGLTAGQASAFYTTSTNSYLGWSVEL